MYAAVFDTHGGPNVVRYREVDTPRPATGEVLVRVHAAAMNHLDLWVRRGLPLETTMPHIGGSDIAGVVAALGPGSDGPEPGTRVVINPTLFCGRCARCTRGEECLCRYFRVLGEHTNGGFAEFVVAPAVNVYAIPDSLSFEAAAALPVSYQTAWRAVLTRARLKPGDEVLIVGASGGTAVAALQIARLAGARIHAVTSGPDRVERVRRLGAEFVYDRLVVDYSSAVYARTGKVGVDVVIDSVGSATWEGSVRALRTGGRLICYGATTGYDVKLDLRRLFWKHIELIGTTMASRGEFEEMLRAACAGLIDPVIDTVLPLEAAAEAHRRLEEGEHFGKIILVP